MKRRTAREKALQALFQIDINEAATNEAIQNVLGESSSDPYLEQLVEGTVEHLEQIDKAISEHLEKWTLERLAKVDLNILRLGVYELLFVEDVPASVVINEALEVSKRFGDERSSKFINGILSKVKESSEK
jgi:transcription antitermination protein NusB